MKRLPYVFLSKEKKREDPSLLFKKKKKMENMKPHK